MQTAKQLGQNPNLTTTLLNNNPEVAKMINDHNGNGKEAFYAKAHEMGYSDVEIDQFVNKLYTMIGKV